MSLPETAPPPVAAAPGAAAVEVWRLDLARPPVPLAELARLLSADERARLARFVRPEDQQRYTLARGALRALLGQALGTAPAAVSLHYTAAGKPFLAQPAGPPGEHLCFNISHSGAFVLIALARGREVGVDVEQWRFDLELERLAQRFFSAQEVAGLLALPAVERGMAFFRCWARKEAYIKARGDGLGLALDSFTVPLGVAATGSLLATLSDDTAEWALYHLEAGPGYGAALAVQGQAVVHWRPTPDSFALPLFHASPPGTGYAPRSGSSGP